MDFWAQRCLEELKEAEEQNVAPAQHTSDRAMADTIMDFLFASQDATTSAVVWVTVLMAEYPDVLQKVSDTHIQGTYCVVSCRAKLLITLDTCAPAELCGDIHVVAGSTISSWTEGLLHGIYSSAAVITAVLCITGALCQSAFSLKAAHEGADCTMIITYFSPTCIPPLTLEGQVRSMSDTLLSCLPLHTPSGPRGSDSLPGRPNLAFQIGGGGGQTQNSLLTEQLLSHL